jgi:hypothetical protein
VLKKMVAKRAVAVKTVVAKADTAAVPEKSVELSV